MIFHTDTLILLTLLLSFISVYVIVSCCIHLIIPFLLHWPSLSFFLLSLFFFFTFRPVLFLCPSINPFSLCLFSSRILSFSLHPYLLFFPIIQSPILSILLFYFFPFLPSPSFPLHVYLSHSLPLHFILFSLISPCSTPLVSSSCSHTHIYFSACLLLYALALSLTLSSFSFRLIFESL